MLYFAYGSNMSRGPMAQRCLTARDAGRAVLRGHRFVIMANGFASAAARDCGLPEDYVARIARFDTGVT
jgi:hypothetical protein